MHAYIHTYIYVYVRTYIYIYTQINTYMLIHLQPNPHHHFRTCQIGGLAAVQFFLAFGWQSCLAWAAAKQALRWHRRFVEVLLSLDVPWEALSVNFWCCCCWLLARSSFFLRFPGTMSTTRRESHPSWRAIPRTFTFLCRQPWGS